MAPSEDFFLGKKYDLEAQKLTDEVISYDPADLTTHGVVTGMTGSGKTGLCIGLLEEAALQGIPAIIIDPKGDLTNLALHFPEPDARRILSPGSILMLPAKKANRSPNWQPRPPRNWKKGLDSWGITSERIAKLAEKADFAIYTPGSDAGIPVSIIASLKAPNIPWEGNREILQEKISSTVSALLGLVG